MIAIVTLGGEDTVTARTNDGPKAGGIEKIVRPAAVSSWLCIVSRVQDAYVRARKYWRLAVKAVDEV